MWTYLLLFLSFATLVVVYVRRLFIFHNGKVIEVKEDRGIMEDDETILFKTKDKLTKEEKLMVKEYSEKGEVLARLGREDEAIKLFVQALALDPEHVETQHKLAMLYMQKQLFGPAAALFKELGNITNDAVHYSHLGLAYYQQNLFDEAKQAYQVAVDLDPSRAQRFVSLAQVYRALGRNQNAVIAMNKAIEIEPTNIDFLFILSEIFIDMDKSLDARKTLEKILDLDPANTEAKKMLKKVIAPQE